MLAAVERKVDDLIVAVQRIEGKIDQLPRATEFFELKGRVSQLPTVWQLFGLIIAVFGLAFVLVRFGMPSS